MGTTSRSSITQRAPAIRRRARGVDPIAQANRDRLGGQPLVDRAGQQVAALGAAEDGAEPDDLGPLDVGGGETPVGGHGPDHEGVAITRQEAESLPGPERRGDREQPRGDHPVAERSPRGGLEQGGEEQRSARTPSPAGAARSATDASARRRTGSGIGQPWPRQPSIRKGQCEPASAEPRQGAAATLDNHLHIFTALLLHFAEVPATFVSARQRLPLDRKLIPFLKGRGVRPPVFSFYRGRADPAPVAWST